VASQWGQAFRVSTFGESHGVGLGCVIDGCPPGVVLDPALISAFLARRRPGQSAYTTPRQENDAPEFLSGVMRYQKSFVSEDTSAVDSRLVTLGSPIAMLVRNTNQKSADYADISAVFRPSHADFTTQTKFGLREAAGGGRSSARETVARVAAAGIALQMLKAHYPALEVTAWVQSVADVESDVDSDKVSQDDVEKSLIRCPDSHAEPLMRAEIESAKADGDTVGGVVACVVRGVPVGLGEPVFDKLEADLAKAMLSLPASKSFEVGSGLAGTRMRGSAHNDSFRSQNGRVVTTTNHSGGIQGGISNGMPILIRVGFKPVSTLFLKQKTVDSNGENVEFSPEAGRHDACVLPRAVPMVEAMVWLVLADHWLRHIALTQKVP
jgi:chorismate synthase